MLKISTICLCLFFENASIREIISILGQPPDYLVTSLGYKKDKISYCSVFFKYFKHNNSQTKVDKKS